MILIIFSMFFVKVSNPIFKSESSSSHPWKIWNDDIDDDIGDTCLLIPITNTLNIEKLFHHSIT
jgi:hypothetical protein